VILGGGLLYSGTQCSNQSPKRSGQRATDQECRRAAVSGSGRAHGAGAGLCPGLETFVTAPAERFRH